MNVCSVTSEAHTTLWVQPRFQCYLYVAVTDGLFLDLKAES